MKFKVLPTQEILRAALDYNSRTGIFVWKHRIDQSAAWNAKFAGKVAGTRCAKGICIYVNGSPYLAHRLAWVYVHGAVPTNAIIDHKNCDQYFNAIRNLRPATHGQNGTNSRGWRKKSLPKGVSIQPHGTGYRSRIGIDGRVAYLGTFDTPEAAHKAYVIAAKAAKGEFARAS